MVKSTIIKRAIKTSGDDHEAFVRAKWGALDAADSRQVNLFDRMFGKAHPNSTFTLAPPSGLPAIKRITVNDEEASKAMQFGEFSKIACDEIDYMPDPVFPDMLRQQLEEFREDFARHVGWSKDYPALIKFLEQHVAKEHEKLFYRTNDFMSASIKLDYFIDFIDQYCMKMKDAGLLTSDRLEQLEEIERIYKLGLDAYNHFGDHLSELSASGNRSILKDAEAAILQERAKQDGNETEAPISATALEHEAHSVVKDVLQTQFAYGKKHRVVPPLMVLLLEKTDKLARLQLAQMSPHLDFRHPDLKADDVLSNRFMSIMESWQARVSGMPTVRDMYAVYVDLDKQVKSLERLPENFEQMIARAKEAGGKAMEANMDESFRAYEATRPFIKPQSSKMIKTDVIETFQPSMRACRRRLKSLTKFDDKEELLNALENQVDMLSDDVANCGTHPAAFFALKHYYEAFRKHLGNAMYDSGCHDTIFLKRLKEIEDKIDLAHENQRELSHWHMQDTSGGHDNAYTYAMITLGMRGDEVKPSDIKRYQEQAQAGNESAAIARGIPEAWAHVQYLPLIYARCRDVAQAIVARTFTKCDRDYDNVEIPRVNQKWVDFATATGPSQEHPLEIYDERREIEPDALELVKKVHSMTRRLFRTSISTLLPAEQREEWLAMGRAAEAEIAAMPTGEPESKESKAKEAFVETKIDEIVAKLAEYPIETTAYNLRVVLDYLDYVERQKSGMALN
jgi:hypothetical protein